jgi:hypothetical protein
MLIDLKQIDNNLQLNNKLIPKPKLRGKLIYTLFSYNVIPNTVILQLCLVSLCGRAPFWVRLLCCLYIKGD